MAIRYKCRACGYAAEVEEGHAGKRGRCPQCRALVSIPEAPVEPPPVGSPQVTTKKPIRKPTWKEKRDRYAAAKKQQQEEQFIAEQERLILHLERLHARSEVEALTSIEEKLASQASSIKEINRDVQSIGRTVAWWIVWIALASTVSCIDSCQRIAGVQETQVRIIRSPY